jgi:rSAM/selenodomain-associated transferase 1
VTPREAQVVVLAKSPQPGKVKTRLTPPYTPHEAADLALAALLDTLQAAAGAAVRRCLLVIAGASGDWLPEGLEVSQQRGVGLDERITHALADAYADLPLPVLMVGMDTPQITSDDLDAAVDVLLKPGVDAVLGPAQDGGYWLLGVRRPRQWQVLGVAMSRPDTGARQLERLRAAGLRVRVLETLRDVDDATDAQAVARTAPRSAFAATLARLNVDGAA